MSNMHIPIISVTGTKGKTTTVAIIDDVLRKLNHNVLKVDTTGHFVNGERKSTLEDSKLTWGLVPSVCPGRYLWEFHKDESIRENGCAVLECSLGCSAGPGLGYKLHDIGVFLNVFEDHLGSGARLKTRQDIANAKDFVYKRLKRGGVAVFNADDELACERLSEVPKNYGVSLVPCGFSFEFFDLESHLKGGGIALTHKNGDIILLKGEKETVLFSVAKIPWTFNGLFMPSVWNLMFSAAAVYINNDYAWDEKVTQAFESVRLDQYGGRLTVMKANNGATIIADYAHEKVSLLEIAKLARSIVKKGGQSIGVVRLAHDRTDELITETGMLVGSSFDKLVIYEKIDGHWRQPININSVRFPQVVGRTSKVLMEGVQKTNQDVERIMREDHAITCAAEIAGPNDVVVIIVNDNIKRSIGFIKEAFKAEFV